jgi:hypothetical protein
MRHDATGKWGGKCGRGIGGAVSGCITPRRNACAFRPDRVPVSTAYFTISDFRMDTIPEQLARRVPRTARRTFVHFIKSGPEAGVYVGSADRPREDDTKIEAETDRRRAGAVAVEVVKALKEAPWSMEALPPRVTGDVETYEFERRS